MSPSIELCCWWSDAAAADSADSGLYYLCSLFGVPTYFFWSQTLCVPHTVTKYAFNGPCSCWSDPTSPTESVVLSNTTLTRKDWQHLVSRPMIHQAASVWVLFECGGDL